MGWSFCSFVSPAKRPFYLPLVVTLAQGLAFIVRLFTSPQAQLNFGPAIL
jgi:hypothetical protein